MKKLLVIIVILFSAFTINAQTASGKLNVNADSLQKVENNKIVMDIITKTAIRDLEQWLFKNWTAEKYSEFVQLYNLFVQERFNERKKLKQ